MRPVRLSLTFCATFLGGCAIHPIPGDVTAPLRTVDLVTAIRCETRSAILEDLAGRIRESDPGLAGNLLQTETVPDFSKVSGTRQAVDLLKKYDNIVVAYEFTFDMTERNDHEIGVDFGQMFTRGTIGFTAGEKLNRSRQNTRIFRLSDNFDRLTRQLRRSTCAENLRGSNAVYPISGTIGMREPMTTFIELNETGSLTPNTSDRLMTETLEFVTEVKASAGPTAELSAVKGLIRLMGIRGSTSIGREDKHKVDVSITMASDEPAPVPVQYVFITNKGFGGIANAPKADERRGSRERASSAATSRKASPEAMERAAQRAFDAIDRNKLNLTNETLKTLQRIAPQFR